MISLDVHVSISLPSVIFMFSVSRGCAGGHHVYAYFYIKRAGGVVKESCYPYTAQVRNHSLYIITITLGQQLGFLMRALWKIIELGHMILHSLLIHKLHIKWGNIRQTLSNIFQQTTFTTSGRLGWLLWRGRFNWYNATKTELTVFSHDIWGH